MDAVKVLDKVLGEGISILPGLVLVIFDMFEHLVAFVILILLATHHQLWILCFKFLGTVLREHHGHAIGVACTTSNGWRNSLFGDIAVLEGLLVLVVGGAGTVLLLLFAALTVALTVLLVE